MIGGSGRNGHLVFGDFYLKPVAFKNHAELECLPFFIKSRIHDDPLLSRLNPAKAKHGRHPGSAVCRRMGSSHENRANIYFIPGFNINLGGFQEITVGPVQFADVSRHHRVGAGAQA